MRLDKFICKSTELTRNEAKKLLKSGEVRVNGEVAKNSAMQVHENNTITIDGQVLTARTSRYFMLHKMVDSICSNVDEIYPSVLNFIDVDKAFDLHIAGRLDADTTGLVLITDDGRWSHNVISPKKDCQKTYRVCLRNAIVEHQADELIEQFKQGIQLQGEPALTRPAILELVYNDEEHNSTESNDEIDTRENATSEVLLTITEGKYHQVKRMFAAVGNRVVGLHREKIGGIELGELAPGEWRSLTEDEIALFS
ncbi:pseudouridine synthase [Colwellia sp. 1_MG-2023]|uniref:pseudouridine synthase n=1 Tax=unclassified Colwellia TaxID=196834 RepID=UPI001C09694B|nr:MULTISPECIES: pseudouridine synthase [unclassified Colwellia]MBU2925746.1 pseudouridine synthase [Colwellia sp. C2M11]MDO6651028.1 pseudouridine synthase [Colwellia sp. 3_MG-2023]MDO6664063.1 pseudouridine synthase [Colwellia sp. 2_MG-2023]MDO6688414.1 pseudouridine synthase [Colwellia sp. 1_MG-2023]